VQHVSQLRETVKAIKENNILKMYVDENVLNFMVHQEFEQSLLQNETIDGTVMFIDICGFTAITEHVSANTVVKLINSIFDMLVKEIIEQGGHIDKFMGDAVMAVFRGDYHMDRAIDAALAVREKIKNAQAISMGDKEFTPQVSIGINSGEMISGNIGSASLKRLDYTVIGDAVNLAQRLQSAAKPNQITISEALHERIKESFSCQKIGEVSMKNKMKPVVVFEVLE
jgi:class 3 adenylate cyclase